MPPPDIPKKKTLSDISSSEHYKQYSENKSINTATVACKPSPHIPPIDSISACPTDLC